MSPIETREIFADNDYIEVAGPIRGMQTSGRRDLYHGADVEGFITDDLVSNVPIGSLYYLSSEIGDTGKYVIAFDGGDISAALAGMTDGDTVYRVVRAPGTFRVVDALIYRTTRPSG